jgi:hypothetical protein
VLEKIQMVTTDNRYYREGQTLNSIKRPEKKIFFQTVISTAQRNGQTA